MLYVSDANGMFASAVDIVRFMQLSAHLPPILVVGIGYRMGAIDETVVVRTRDFTPTYDAGFVRVFPTHTMMGGAPRFLAFIRDELQPWVQSRYRVDVDDSAFFGHSLGGLFATYVLLTEPATFRRYGIGSPSLWWDGDMMFDYEARCAEARDDLPAKVFFAVGAHEDHDGRQREASRLPADERAKAGLRYIDMVADTERMVAALRSRHYPSLEIDSIGPARRVPRDRAARQPVTLAALPLRRAPLSRSFRPERPSPKRPGRWGRASRRRRASRSSTKSRLTRSVPSIPSGCCSVPTLTPACASRASNASRNPRRDAARVPPCVACSTSSNEIGNAGAHVDLDAAERAPQREQVVADLLDEPHERLPRDRHRDPIARMHPFAQPVGEAAAVTPLRGGVGGGGFLLRAPFRAHLPGDAGQIGMVRVLRCDRSRPWERPSAGRGRPVLRRGVLRVLVEPRDDLVTEE